MAAPRLPPERDMRLPRGVALFAITVGACDAATGAALIALPLWTLRQMGIATLPAEPVFVRWIGAFVLAVGLSYLYPFVLRSGGSERLGDRLGSSLLGDRLASTFEVTALVRILVALVAGSAVLTGRLELAWVGVPLFDLAVAATQLVLLRRGGLRHG